MTKLINSKECVTISFESFKRLYKFYEEVKYQDEDLRFMLFNYMACYNDIDSSFRKHPITIKNHRDNNEYLEMVSKMHKFKNTKANKLFEYIDSKIKKLESIPMCELDDNELGSYKVYRKLKKIFVEGYDAVIKELNSYNHIYSSGDCQSVYLNILQYCKKHDKQAYDDLNKD